MQAYIFLKTVEATIFYQKVFTNILPVEDGAHALNKPRCMALNLKFYLQDNIKKLKLS